MTASFTFPASSTVPILTIQAESRSTAIDSTGLLPHVTPSLGLLYVHQRCTFFPRVLQTFSCPLCRETLAECGGMMRAYSAALSRTSGRSVPPRSIPYAPQIERLQKSPYIYLHHLSLATEARSTYVWTNFDPIMAFSHHVASVMEQILGNQ